MLRCMVAEDATLWVRPFGDPGQHRRLGLDELATVYDALEIGPDSVFWWDGRSGDGALSGSVIVSLINDERCLVILRMQADDHFLVEPGSDDDTIVIIRGARVTVPRSAVLPRRRGLEVLQAVGDLLYVRDNNAWRKVRGWRDDPLHERLGDLVEDLLDAAFELVLTDPDGEPAGLRHFGNLMLLHSAVMSGGIGKVRWDRPERFVESAAAGAEHLGLTDLAAVIRRIGTDPDEDCGWRLEALYHEYSGPFGDDAGMIRAAVARRFDTAPESFGPLEDIPYRSRPLL
jgi:hypothetical protein